MYKVGDKVETRLGVGEVITVTNGWITVDILDYLITAWHLDIEPYRTAHEKLIEMGWKLEKVIGCYNQVYLHKWLDTNDDVRIRIYLDDKTFTTFELPNEHIGILTQYLEELEND